MVGLILLVIIVGLVILGPQFWTKRVFAKHSTPRPDYPGTGAELARHLLNRFDLQHIKVEPTETGDHYDPVSKAVRLTPAIFDGKSLTAITIAAHEVGHAIQDHLGYQPLAERTKLVRVAQGAEKVGAVLMMGIPIAAAVARTPAGECRRSDGWNGDDGDFHAGPPRHASRRVGRQLPARPACPPTGPVSDA